MNFKVNDEKIYKGIIDDYKFELSLYIDAGSSANKTDFEVVNIEGLDFDEDHELWEELAEKILYNTKKHFRDMMNNIGF